MIVRDILNVDELTTAPQTHWPLRLSTLIKSRIQRNLPSPQAFTWQLGLLTCRGTPSMCSPIYLNSLSVWMNAEKGRRNISAQGRKSLPKPETEWKRLWVVFIASSWRGHFIVPSCQPINREIGLHRIQNMYHTLAVAFYRRYTWKYNVKNIDKNKNMTNFWGHSVFPVCARHASFIC